MNIDIDSIHPELRKSAKVIRFLIPYFKLSTFKKANFLLHMNQNKKIKTMRYKNEYIYPKTDTENKLRLAIYSPLNYIEKMTGIIWMHGGGYAFGTPEQEIDIIKEFVEKFNCVVVAPDYTLSLDKPYPAALLDCYSALKWLNHNASDYNVNTKQIMVGGVSAGGGLAAALAIYARDKGEIPIAYQMLIYPMLDDRMITKTSQFEDSPLWNSKSNELAWQLYLGSLYKASVVPYYAAPARLENFEKLPPAYAYVGDLDPFCDETIEYMEKLKKADIHSIYDIFPGCFHAFDVVGKNTSPAKLAKSKLLSNFQLAQKNYYC